MSNLETPKRRGRPAGSSRAEPGSRVSLWVPASAHDQLIRLANGRSQSVSAYLRELVVVRIRARSR